MGSDPRTPSVLPSRVGPMSREATRFYKWVDGVRQPVNPVQHIPDEHTTCPLVYTCGCSGVLYQFYKEGELPTAVAARLAEAKAEAETQDCGRHDASREARLRFFKGEAEPKAEEPPEAPPAAEERPSPMAAAFTRAERQRHQRQAEGQAAYDKWKAAQSGGEQDGFSRRKPEGGKLPKVARPRRK